jgi:hypothetical protein
MEKRQITDNIILVQEVIHTSKAKGDKGMIIKIDMANAFDWLGTPFSLMFSIGLDSVKISYGGSMLVLAILGFHPWSMGTQPFF